MPLPALELFGRTHPMVLHLPIGMFAAIAALEALAVVRHRPLDPDIRRILLRLAAASAVVTAAAGLTLSAEPGYRADAIQLHKWLGIAAGLLSLLCLLAVHITRFPWLYWTTLAATLGVLIPAGHFGAELTHGRGYLLAPLRAHTPPLRQAMPVAPVIPSSDLLYSRDIAPIFAARCTRCHGAENQKGDLALHIPEAIGRGGQSGPVIVPGDVLASELVRRLRLPESDEDHMPPSSKPQPTRQEIEAIERWIAAGARVDR